MFSSICHVIKLFFVTLLENSRAYQSVREREREIEMCDGRETDVKSYVLKLEGVGLLERTKHQWNDNIKLNLKDKECSNVLT